jgi:hypothetical protein
MGEGAVGHLLAAERVHIHNVVSLFLHRQLSQQRACVSVTPMTTL